MAFDAYAHEDARRMFSLTLACAEEADNWHLRAKALSSMARQAIWRGDPDTGLTLTEFALIRSDRLTPTERAMLLSAQSRALAKLGRAQDTLTAVGRADDEFAHTSPANDPDWMGYYDHAQHMGDTGHSLFDLAVRNPAHSREAAQRLGDAVKGHRAAFNRSRTISQTKLASLLMLTGDPQEAAAIGTSAVKVFGTIHSRRATDDMHELASLARPHERQSDVVTLREMIRHTVGRP